MDFKELIAYKKAFDLANAGFGLSNQFPKEEMYSLADQIRRSSRSVCANIAESYRKRLYVKHFVSKLTDADAENSETVVWLDFALSCKYISNESHQELVRETNEIGRLINYMISNSGKFGCNE